MAANSALAIPEHHLEVKDERVDTCAPLTVAQRIKNALNTIFAGHEEFFGCTPD